MGREGRPYIDPNVVHSGFSMREGPHQSTQLHLTPTSGLWFEQSVVHPSRSLNPLRIDATTVYSRENIGSFNIAPSWVQGSRLDVAVTKSHEGIDSYIVKLLPQLDKEGVEAMRKLFNDGEYKDGHTFLLERFPYLLVYPTGMTIMGMQGEEFKPLIQWDSDGSELQRVDNKGDFSASSERVIDAHLHDKNKGSKWRAMLESDEDPVEMTDEEGKTVCYNPIVLTHVAFFSRPKDVCEQVKEYIQDGQEKGYTEDRLNQIVDMRSTIVFR